MTPGPVAGELGCALLLSFLVLNPVRAKRQSVRAATILLTIGVVLVPLHDLSLAGALRSVTGDLSITSIVLVVSGIGSRWLDREIFSYRNRRLVMLFAGIGGLAFYPPALGLTYGDPYTWGYGSPLLFIALLGLSLAAVHYECYLPALCATGAVAAYTLGIYESTNLWDYLLDPLLTVYALGWLLTRQSRKQKGYRGLPRAVSRQQSAVSSRKIVHFLHSISLIRD